MDLSGHNLRSFREQASKCCCKVWFSGEDWRCWRWWEKKIVDNDDDDTNGPGFTPQLLVLLRDICYISNFSQRRRRITSSLKFVGLQFEQVHKLGSNCSIEMGHSFCWRDVNNKTKSNGDGYHATSGFKKFYC